MSSAKVVAQHTVGNLNKDVFERRTSTGSLLFVFFDIGFAHIFEDRLGSHLRQIFQMSEDVADNFVSELVRGN